MEAIPGYKVILKAVLKGQIQYLVEQLASQTGEETLVLTASISDGSLSELGTESGKVFLKDHDETMSQFLGFCVNRCHMQHPSKTEKENKRHSCQKSKKRKRSKTDKPPPSPVIAPSKQNVSPHNLTSLEQLHPIITNTLKTANVKVNKTPLLSPQQRVFPQEQEPPDELQASETNTPEAAFIKNETQIETEENTQSSELTVRETEIQVENDILLSNLKIEVQDDTTDIEAIDSSSIIASDLALSDSSDATSPVNSSSSAAQSKSPHLAQSKGNYTPPVYNSLSTVQDVEMLTEEQSANDGSVSTICDEQHDTDQTDETDNDKQCDTAQTDETDNDDNEGPGSFESDHGEKSHIEDDLKSEETNIHKSQETDQKDKPIAEFREELKDKPIAQFRDELKDKPKAEFSDELDRGNGEPDDPAYGGDGEKVQQVSGKMGDVSTLSTESQNIQENLVCKAEKKFKYGKKNLRQHICQECQKIYQTYNGLRKHTQKHLNEQPYQCYTCNRQFSDRQHLQGHMTSHENDKFKCDNCEKLFGYLSGLRRHKLKCVDNKPDAQQNKRLMCHFCGYTCVRGDRLRDHMDGKHAKEGMHECPHCHKVFRWHNTDLKDKKPSQRSQSKKCSLFQCTECTYVTKRSFNYKRHLREMHGNLQGVVCQICGKMLKSISNLSYHLLKHGRQFQYSCTVCGKGFEIKQNFKSHVIGHMAENGFKCDYCDQKLQGYKKLRLHIKSEHSDRSVTFTCSVCAKVFLSGSKLRSHITKRHEGAEMPWKCSLCNKSYQHHSSLKYHARFAHPDQVGDLENGNSDQSQFTGGDTDKVEN